MEKRTIIARILFLLYLGALAWLCFGNFSSLPSVSMKLFGLETDKLVHFTMFFPFPLLLFLSLKVSPKSRWQLFSLVLLAFALGCATGAVTEFVQGMTPTRVPDIRDFYADVAGCITSTVLTFFIFLRHAK